MKKVCLFLILSLSFSLCFISCDDTGSDTNRSANDSVINDNGTTDETSSTDTSGDTSDVKTLSDEEKAAYSIAIIDEGLQNISLADLASLASSKVPKASPAPSVEGILDPVSIPLGTIYDADDMKIDASLIMGWQEGIGIGLTMDLNNYKIPTTDGSEVSVTGEISLVMAYQTQYLIDQKIVIYADTPVDNQLLFTGGLMDGQKIGLDNLELGFSISELNIGSPVVVKGTVLVNDVPLYVDSEILEFLLNFI